jgi:transmembrane sensor
LNNEPQHIDDLIGKFLAGEASEQERVLVQKWLDADESNVHYYDQVKTIFNKAGSVKGIQEFNTDAAWSKVKANLKSGGDKVIPLKQRSLTLWYQIAAAVVVLFGIGWFLLRSGTSGGTIPPVEVIAEQSAISDTLPDGSNVFLNKKTIVAYAFETKTKTHHVKLKGEAYFNINAKKKQEEFIIDAGGVFIRDIGTSFNVKAYPDSDEVEVLVEEGEVIFFTTENAGINLKASGKGVYNKSTKTFTIEQPDPNVTAYKTKFFVFSRTDLKTLAETLNRVYDKPVIIPEKLGACTITVTFRDESIEEIAGVIAETLGLTVREVNNQIVFDGERCQ